MRLLKGVTMSAYGDIGVKVSAAPNMRWHRKVKDGKVK